jgi:hypothetical protein
VPIVPYLRLAKLVAVVLLGAGTIGATLPLTLEQRRWFAYRMAGPGFGLTWTLGLLWAAVTDVPLTSSWILGSMVLSMVSLQAVLYLGGRAERGGPVASFFALAPLIACLALMVFRP